MNKKDAAAGGARQEGRGSRALVAAALLTTAALVPPGVQGASVDSLQTLKELMAQGQYERAWALGQAAEARYEGDAEFDFQYGLAALESGHYAEAIFALERVVFRQPAQLRVRLELGRAHFLAGNYLAAEREFSRVLAQDPPPSVAANINRFLNRIEAALRSQRRDLGFWADARVGVDSNINSATDSAQIATPIGNFDLVQDGRELDDEFVRWELGGRLREPLTKDASLDVAARWEQKNNFSTDTFDLGIAAVDAGYSKALDNGRYRVGVRLQNVVLDKDRFQNSYGVVGTWDRTLAQNLILSMTGAVTALRYAGDHLRDTDQFLVSGTLVRPMGKLVHSLSLYGAMEPARDSGIGEHNGRDFYGALYGLQYDGGRLQPYLRAGVQQAEYAEDHPVFARVRDDLTLTASAGAQWQLWEGLLLTGEASWTDVDSNLPVFAYDRFLFEFGLRQAF